MKNVFVALMFLFVSVFAFAQDDALVGSLDTLGNRGPIEVWADGSGDIHINMPAENGFTLNKNEVSDFIDHLNQYDKFVAKATETKIVFTDTLLNTACAVEGPSGAKIYLFASSSLDGTSYLGVELYNPYNVKNYGESKTYWLDSKTGQQLKSLLIDALSKDSDISEKIKTMHNAARGQQ